jgi:erythromycin esterase
MTSTASGRLPSPPRRTLAVSLALALSLAACGDDEDAADLPRGVHPLSGISHTLPHRDLEPLRGIVGGARFVALGESTHTSGGYYQAKFRVFRFLVEEMGFRVLAFENSWLEAQPATRYVATCEGSPEAAIRSLNGVWRAAEVRNLLRWMCDYNRAHPADPVTFFGFDVQEPWMSQPAVRGFLQAAAPQQLGRAEPLRSCLGATHAGPTGWYASQEFRDHQAGIRNAAKHQTCIGGITALESWLAQHQAALEAASSARALEEARISLVSLRAWEDQLWQPDPAGYQARDSGMAEVLLRLHALETPGKKTAVWAWNFHIARNYQSVHGWDEDPTEVVPRQGARAMGGFLSDALGADYVPIGLIGYLVETNGGLGQEPPSWPESVELRLHGLGEPYLLVDLRGPVGDGLLVPGTRLSFSREWGDPFQQFAALLFLDRSAPMTFAQSGTSAD